MIDIETTPASQNGLAPPGLALLRRLARFKRARASAAPPPSPATLARNWLGLRTAPARLNLALHKVVAHTAPSPGAFWTPCWTIRGSNSKA